MYYFYGLQKANLIHGHFKGATWKRNWNNTYFSWWLMDNMLSTKDNLCSHDLSTWYSIMFVCRRMWKRRIFTIFIFRMFYFWAHVIKCFGVIECSKCFFYKDTCFHLQQFEELFSCNKYYKFFGCHVGDRYRKLGTIVYFNN